MNLFSSVADLLRPAPPPDPAVVEALARATRLTDPLLGAASHLDQRLAEPLQYALGYCAGLVDALPGPLDVSHQAFARDPLVHALFATADDIAQMLGRSAAVRDYLAQPASLESDSFYAMLAARRQQKHQLGLAREGEVIRHDVPQTVVFFSDQTLLAPAGELDATRHDLRQRALDSLFLSFGAHVRRLREEREGLRADLAMERAQLTLAAAARGEAQHTRHLESLDQQLRNAADALDPEHLAAQLAAFLLAPEPSLGLSAVDLRLDRMGIVSPHGDPASHTLHFPELHARDQRRHTVVLARIDRREAAEAVERVTDQQHRFMLL